MHAQDTVSTVFDEYVPTEGLHLRALSTLFEALGIDPATTRARLSRMRRDGMLVTARDGRESVYATSPALQTVLAEDRARSLRRGEETWDGTWTMVLYQIPESQRTRREKLKRVLAEQGFGQLNPTTWISAHDDRERMHRDLGCHEDPRIVVVTARTGGLDEDRAFARRCWDFDQIAADYRAFLDRWTPIAEADPAPTGQEAFRARVEIVSDWRHFPHHDPRLPLALQPEGTHAAEAFALFRALEARLAAPAQTFVDRAQQR